MNIDSIIPNLALKKIEMYHRLRGDTIEFNPWYEREADRIYVSCVFDWNKQEADYWLQNPKALVGGTGSDLDTVLPPEIESLKPKLNMGFTTRGCIRNCYFCKVPHKEGKPSIYGDLYDIWDGKSEEITLMDNNILAIPEHFKLVCSQIKKEGLKVDFNQGLDHRLITDELARVALSVKQISVLRFAFDDLAFKPTVLRAIKILNDNGMKPWGSRWYVYVGEKDTAHTVLERLEILRTNKQCAYVMRDRKVYSNKQYIAIAKWGNSVAVYKTPFKTVLQNSDGLKMYLKYFDTTTL